MTVRKKDGDEKIWFVIWKVINNIPVNNQRSRSTGTQRNVGVTANKRAQEAIDIRPGEGETTQGRREIRKVIGHSWDVWSNNRRA